MNELRKDQSITIELRDKSKIYGVVEDFELDRVFIKIAADSYEIAKKIKELDLVLVDVSTHLGSKKMFSHVIDPLDSKLCLIVENNEPIASEQRREFVRVNADFIFEAEKENGRSVKCKTDNLSGGGIAFTALNGFFEVGELFEIKFSKEVFEHEIYCKARIVKIIGDIYAAQFDNLSPFIEGKIIKQVYKLITKK
ncbi:MAG: PilZ domain-containing protein [Candidatus Gastranaerophilales bacterium]|nr:PilZ domain-containing protein [Candidatus Gastranaerophilales bacterium]